MDEVGGNEEVLRVRAVDDGASAVLEQVRQKEAAVGQEAQRSANLSAQAYQALDRAQAMVAARLTSLEGVEGKQKVAVQELAVGFERLQSQWQSGEISALQFANNLSLLNKSLLEISATQKVVGEAAATAAGPGRLGFMIRQIGAMEAASLGMNSRLGMILAGLTPFAVGSGWAIAIIGGLAAMTYAWEKLTDQTDKQADSVAKAADAWNKLALSLTNPALQRYAHITSLQQDITQAQALVQAEEQRVRRETVASVGLAGGAATEADIQRAMADDQRVFEARKALIQEQADLQVLLQNDLTKTQQEADKAHKRELKDQTEELHQQVELARAFARALSGTHGIPKLDMTEPDFWKLYGKSPVGTAAPSDVRGAMAGLGGVPTDAVGKAIQREIEAERLRLNVIDQLRVKLGQLQKGSEEYLITEELLRKALEEENRAKQRNAMAALQAAQEISAAGNVLLGLINALQQHSTGGFLQGLGGVLGLFGKLNPYLAVAGAALGVVGGVVSALDRPTPVHVATVSSQAARQINPQPDVPQAITVIVESGGVPVSQTAYAIQREQRRGVKVRVPLSKLSPLLQGMTP